MRFILYLKKSISEWLGFAKAISRRDIWLVLAVSALCGFFVAAVGSFRWQDAVESGQVVAGIIKLPQDNPGYLYHMNAYSLIIQAAAFLLRLGLSEKAVSFIFSGLQGAFSFSAISACTLALSRMPVLSLAVPFLSGYLRAYAFEHNYPIPIGSATCTFGVLGLALLFLIIGLFSLGENKIAALLLGLMPALHLTLGIFGWLIIGATVICENHALRKEIPTIIKFFLIGTAIFIFNYIYHRLFIYHNPHLPADLIAQYHTLYMRNVEWHVVPMALSSLPVLIVVLSAFLSLIWLLFFRKDLLKGAFFILYAFIFCAIIGLVYTLIYRNFSDSIPPWIMVFMPNRVMNINSLGIFPFILGLLGLYSYSLTFFILLLLFLLQVPLVTLLWKRQYCYWDYYSTFAFYFMAIATIAIGGVRFMSKKIIFIPQKISRLRQLFMRFLSVSMIIFICLCLIYIYIVLRPEYLSRETSDQPFFVFVGKRPGLLLTPPQLHLAQSRSRRAVLLDADYLDTAKYTPELAPGLDKILKRVYGINDFFTRRRTDCADDYLSDRIENVFRERSLPEWKKIAREFGFTDVMVPGEWKLNLPEVAQSFTKEYRLYHIPE